MNRSFKGVWIPRSIWEDERLNPTERCFLAEIDSLTGDEGCYASREFFAERMGLSEQRISDILTKFRKLKLIVDISFDGRTKVIATAWSSDGVTRSQTSCIQEGRLQENKKSSEANTIYIENNLDNSKKIIKTPEELEEQLYPQGTPSKEDERLARKKARRENKAKNFHPVLGSNYYKNPQKIFVKKERTIARGEDIV